MCPTQIPYENEWVNYRDLKDSGPLAAYYSNNTLAAISKLYEGRKDILERVASGLGCVRPRTNYQYDVSVVLNILPRIPVLLLFNDRDDELSAQTTILFERSSECFLDAECLAMLAGNIPNWLRKAEDKRL